MYSYEFIAVEKAENIATLTFNRPDKMNSMPIRMVEEWLDAMRQLEADVEVRVVIITGKGRAFCVGGDIDEYSVATPEWMTRNNRLFLDTFRQMEMMRKPIIAAVNGHANMEIYQACDLVILADDAKVGLPEIKIGVKPGAGIDQRLPRWIGRLKAKEIIFFGEWIDAKEAERLGLANKVVPGAELLDHARTWAKKLTSLSAPAIGAIKLSVNLGSEMDIDKGLEFQLREFLQLFDTKEQKEQMRLFLERNKRK
jgi:enoyl-CoA hydratase/carnithine racemase